MGVSRTARAVMGLLEPPIRSFLDVDRFGYIKNRCDAFAGQEVRLIVGL